MFATTRRAAVSVLVAGCFLSGGLAQAEPQLPENLAAKAKLTVSSKHGEAYQAINLVDGRIPAAMSRADVGQAWCAKGNQHPDGVTVTFEWPQPVTVATVVYYGRTAFHLGENWKDYELSLGEGGPPVAKGQFKAGHGPQPVNLPEPASTTRLTLKFLSCHGGPNPGASEIQVYSVGPPAAALAKFVPAAKIPVSDPSYLPVAASQIEESPELAARLASGSLGFTKLVLAQRHHIRCSHVHTYHCEGQSNGGGLYLYDVAGGDLTRLVDSTEGQIQTCDLSYDGATILFGWRRSSEYYQLYSIHVDGTGLRQLTEGDYHNYDGAWLPDGRIVFLSTRRPQAA